MPVDQMPMSLEDVQRLYDRPAIVRSATGGSGGSDAALPVQKERAKAVFDSGLKVGLKSGLVWQINVINGAVSEDSRNLDTIYNFGQFMINGGVVPAVITESRNLYNQEGGFAVRKSKAFYKIEQQARFSSVPPSWREYLNFPRGKGVERDDVISLRDDDERAVWRLAVKNGWGQGVEQANLMLDQAMDRLNRDFGGMALFHKFVTNGMVTLPVIATQDVPVTHTGATMAVDETLLRLTALPEFNSKVGSWEAVVIGNSEIRPADKQEAVKQQKGQ